jgi:NTP pyrophosphatase (non-canonical NTP hydrolase)
MKPTVPTKTENPSGFHQRYNIQHLDGSPMDEGFEGFVLRLDESGTGEPNHVRASRAAITTYASAIKPYIPDLARDLEARYGPHSIDDYQEIAATLSRMKEFTWPYLILALCGEATEVELAMRAIPLDKPVAERLPALGRLREEIGDVVYYCCMAAKKLNMKASTLIAEVPPEATSATLTAATGLMANGLKKCLRRLEEPSNEWLRPRVAQALGVAVSIGKLNHFDLSEIIAVNVSKLRRLNDLNLPAGP